MQKKMKILLVTLALIFGLATLAAAESGARSKEEIAKELGKGYTVKLDFLLPSHKE